MTAVWGRIWCGWGCPQTVFIDGVYRRIEKWVEGTPLEQMKLHREKMSFRKFRLKFVKWILFFIVSAIIAHSFLAYFVGSKELMAMMQKPPTDNWTYFVLVFVMTGLVLFDFAWFREQFCIIMCPYGRFQSVLLDSRSQTIFYDAQRGEPRKGAVKEGEKQGDCISCNRCVNVCPTMIDIRNGLQMECIACTACIDACDEIMEKVKKPKGLIRYASLKGQTVKWKTPRSMVYIAVMVLAVAGLSYNISHRAELNYSLLRGIDSAFTVTKDESGQEMITNHFRLHLKNQSPKDKKYSLRLMDSEHLKLVTPQNPVVLGSFESKTIHFFVSASREFIGIKLSETLKLSADGSNQEEYTIPLTLVGPGDVRHE